MKSIFALVTALTLSSVMAEEYPVLVNYPGDVGKQNWKMQASEAGKIVYIPFEGYYESKGGRIESPKFAFDKKEGETAFYQLTYTAKSKNDGYWWVDFFDKDDQPLPDINSRLYASGNWQTCVVQFPADPRAVKGQLAFISSNGCAVQDVSLRRVSIEDAAKWCDQTYAKLPQLQLDLPADPFLLLPKTRQALLEGRKLRVVLLGDSIINDTYCSCFTALVMREFPNVEFIISVRGSTGVNYYHEEKNFEACCAKYKPDLVIIGGISNHVGGNYDVTQADMEETIDRCRAIGAEVVVTTPPPSYEWRWNSEQTTWNENFAIWQYQGGWMKRMQFWTPMWQDYQRKACANKVCALWDLTTAPANAIAFSRKPINWFKRDSAHNDDRGKQLLGQTLAAYFHQAKALRAKMAFRPPALPLIVNDPLFSIWSRGSTLTTANTTNWRNWKEHVEGLYGSKEPQWVYAAAPLGICVQIGDRSYRLCGTEPRSVPALRQVSAEVRPLSTVVKFADERTEVELTFQTPFLTDNLDVFSRPVSYVHLRAQQKDKIARPVTMALSAGGEICSDDPRAYVKSEAVRGPGYSGVRLGRVVQCKDGDEMKASRPNWGYVNLVFAGAATAAPNLIATPAGEQRANVSQFIPATVDANISAAIAYDFDGRDAQFLGKTLKGWWARDGKTFEKMLGEAIAEYPRLAKRMNDFDKAFAADMKSLGGDKYADLACLAYRQSYGACKLFCGPDGKPWFCSKENGSGSMISTTDVLYPQFPHMLFTSLELAKATLRPGLSYAASDQWPYEYAPHDLGQYPLMNGQYYGMWDRSPKNDAHRMPVEECGNMLICLAAVASAERTTDFVAPWWGQITKWAEYLARVGYNPENQLCTDDFAGYLAHNVNLSVKAILGLASYARLAQLKGEKDVANKYLALAKDFAAKWLTEAKGGAEGGYRLAFDKEDTWSLKYNLVWDRLLEFNLFPESVAKAEMKVYRAKMLSYGTPLDNRSNYTKADWIVWAATLTMNRGDFDAMIEPLWKFAQETPDRIPLTDWYWADSARYRGFEARSVVGAFYLPALYDAELVNKWRNQ